MKELDHWHPVLLSRELGDRPRAVTLCAQKLVVWRSEAGVAALDDACPHRGFPLSEGRVVGGCVECPYHGWRWDSEGRGESPGNPRSKPCATRYECVERLGAVWVRRAGAETAFPFIDVGGHALMGTARVRASAPLEVVLDNFIEVEHTPEVHMFLGYRRDDMARVDTETTATDDSVRVWNHGPQRPLPWAVRKLFEIPEGAYFVDDWTTRFSPVHSVYEQYFLDGPRGRRVSDALRIAVFFTPITARETDLIVMAYTSASPWAQPLLSALRLPSMMAMVRIEVERDRRLLASMRDAPTSLRHRALGRFDQGLVAARKLLERVYRGRDEKKLPVTE
ncbi:MAG: Rieske 2Fe-2S domain-containing protein [Polyangiales bacterium]